MRAAIGCALAVASTLACDRAPRSPESPAPPSTLATAPSVALPQDVVALLAARGRGVRPYGTSRGEVGVVADVASSEWRRVVDELQRAAGLGVTAYAADEPTGATVRVALVRVDDPLEPLRFAGTSGTRPGLDADELITRVRAWDASFGVSLKGASDRWLAIKPVFRVPPDVLAAEAAELCEPQPGVLASDDVAAAIERDDLLSCRLR